MALALMHDRFGPPLEVLVLREVTLREPGPGEVRVRLLVAAVHPSDTGRIDGRYGTRPVLPAVGGREGVAVVEAVGDEVSTLRTGDRVLLPKDRGAWQSVQVHEASALVPVPPGVPDAQAALVRINPGTAWNLVHRFAKDGPVVANGGSSAVVALVAQVCRHVGRPCGVLARDPSRAAAVEQAGGKVFPDTDDGAKALASWAGPGGAGVALNAVGGESAIRLFRALRDGGIHVTYGGAAFEPVRWPTRQLIFSDHVVRGYWHDRWERNHAPEAAGLLARMLDLLATGALVSPVATSLTFDAWRGAFEGDHAPGKVVLVP